jgi:predicted RNase H-like nuclease (RuvC/YqgF family)
MVYAAEYRLCGACDESKLTTEFYKTIPSVCKSCRNEYTKEERQRSREEEEFANKRRDREINKLKKTTLKQTDAIDDMGRAIESMEGEMEAVKEKLDRLSILENKMKGMSIAGKLKAKRNN